MDWRVYEIQCLEGIEYFAPVLAIELCECWFCFCSEIGSKVSDVEIAERSTKEVNRYSLSDFDEGEGEVSIEQLNETVDQDPSQK